jgi:Transglutaminase-like enzymes, putative cysteine proteases
MSSTFFALSRLPREARDTLFLLGVVGWIIVPLIPHVPPWASAFAAALLLWRAGLAWRGRPLPGRWVLGGLLALAVAGTGLTFKTLAGRDAGVTLIVLLLALKTLELRARRDAMVVFFLGFFTLLSNFLFSQSLPTAAAMLLALLGLLTALVQAHMPVGRPPLMLAMRTALRLMLLGAPVMAALFLLFPRIAPLWGLPKDTLGRSGLAGDMQVGRIAALALDDGIALRVRFDLPNGKTPPQSALYFRGPVLASFDGRTWRPLDDMAQGGPWRRISSPAALQVSGAPLRYEVTLEPHQQNWLLLIDAAPAPPGLPEGFQAAMSPELLWRTNRPVMSVLRYRAESYPQFRHGPLQRNATLNAYTELPAGFNPRTLALAAQLRAQTPVAPGADPAPALVQAALARLRTGGYRYTLEPGVFGTHSADEFWFDRKQGFCEHIASAFVVLLRAMGLPARIVTGYQGGEVNPVDGYWTVRHSDAHAWTEVWLAGQGWVRVDPTAAVGAGARGQLCALAGPRRRLRHGREHRHQPRHGAAAARRLGGDEQRLEPMGAQLHAGPPARLAARAGLRRARVARPDSPARRALGRSRAGRRRLDAVGAAPARPLAAPARAHAPAPRARGPAAARAPAAARHGPRGASTLRPRCPAARAVAAAAGAAALRCAGARRGATAHANPAHACPHMAPTALAAPAAAPRAPPAPPAPPAPRAPRQWRLNDSRHHAKDPLDCTSFDSCLRCIHQRKRPKTPEHCRRRSARGASYAAACSGGSTHFCARFFPRLCARCLPRFHTSSFHRSRPLRPGFSPRQLRRPP